MKLIELSSTRSTFRTVRFNRSGLTLIVGKPTKKQTRNIQSTYNGVGKSLLVSLIHFCLGSSSNKHFESHLEGWDFTLAFEHNGKQYLATRTVGEETIDFNGTNFRLKTTIKSGTGYIETLNDLGVFDLPSDANSLTFRSLISFFLRPTRNSYNSPDIAIAQWTPYSRILYASFLLGIDYRRAIQKHDARKDLEEQLLLAKKYKSDKDLREFFIGGKNAEMEVASLAERIEKLEVDLTNFNVAKDYSDREESANTIRNQLAEVRGDEAILTVRLANIALAMSIRPDVTPERVKKLYDEAKFALPELVLKRLVDVDAFYARLRDNRMKRLEQEKSKAEAELKQSQSIRVNLERQLDQLFQYLKAHRALDEYTENNRFLADLIARRRKIEDYLSLLAKYTQEAQRIRAEMTTATLQTTEYLKTIKPHTDRLMEFYRNFAREFYGDKPAGLVVRNNDGDNQTRYDIEARIEHDQADGINDIRIFCFDLLLLTLRQRHSVEFLMHDSRLFDGVDPRQKWTLFRIAHIVCKENDLQYIATINEDNIETMRDAAGEDYERVLVDTRVLELTDEPDGSGKLLGVQIEMKYEDT